MWQEKVREWLNTLDVNDRHQRTQRELAHLAGCSTEYLNKCLNGSLVPSNRILRLLAQAMGLAPETLVALKDAGQSEAAEEARERVLRGEEEGL